MKIAYSSYSKTAQNDELPYGCQGIRHGIKKVCDELGYEFGSYFKEPDVLLVELTDLGLFSISHLSCAKCCSMIKTAKKIILVCDDAFMITQSALKKLSLEKVPFTLRGDSQKLITEIFSFNKRVLSKEFDLILPIYSYEFSDYYPAKHIIQFDYSHLHDYNNVYREKEKKILSYSFREKDLDYEIEKISGRELDCFKKLCEHRICYMTDYGKQVPFNWVRNRYAQCYNANALMVGMKNSYFGNAFNIEPDDLDNFEEKVLAQRQVFEENTMKKECVIQVLKEALNG